jgi:hypothetical protein
MKLVGCNMVGFPCVAPCSFLWYLYLFCVGGILPTVALPVMGAFPLQFFKFSVFGGGIPPPSRVFLYSSSVKRSACAPSGRAGPPLWGSSSGTSSMLTRCRGLCSHSLCLSIARYHCSCPSVSAKVTLVVGVATLFTITWLFSKSNCTLLCLMYGVPIIMS